MSGNILSALPSHVHALLGVDDASSYASSWVGEEASRSGLSASLTPLRSTPTRDLQAAARDWLKDNSVDKLVLFNDQSVRGAAVARAARAIGVPVVAVQDGHLVFDYKTVDAARSDPNWSYGYNSDHVCAWGPSLKSHIYGRRRSGAPFVHVTGSLGVSDQQALSSAITNPQTLRTEPNHPLKILVIDQPLADQSKVSRTQYESMLRDICTSLEDFHVRIRPHPSSTSTTLAFLENVQNIQIVPSSIPLTSALLEGFDLAVTYYSSSYIDTVMANMPLVFLDHEFLDLAFPRLHHPLLRNVQTTEELRSLASTLQDSGRFLGNPSGELMQTHLLPVTDAAKAVIEVVLQAESRSDGIAAERTVETGPTVRELNARNVMDDLLGSVLPPRALSVVGDDFSYLTGVAVPILTYAQRLASHPSARVEFVNIKGLRTADRLRLACSRASHVMFNSAAAFWRWDHTAQVARELIDQGKPVFLFMHETEFTAERAMQTHPHRFESFLGIIPDVRVLCVSQGQATYVRSLGARDVTVVYNTVPGRSTPIGDRRSAGERDRLTAIMVGTVQDRKGPDLFSRVAELADSEGMNLTFKWIGPRVKSLSEDVSLSDLVEWVGPLRRDEVDFELSNADMFFMPSIDDPMPLAAIEAIHHRLRIVTSTRVGTWEILRGVRGYSAFHEYSAVAALSAIRVALNDEVDADAYDQIAEIFDSDSFALRVNTALHFHAGDSAIRQGRIGHETDSVSFSNEDFFRALQSSAERAIYVGEAILRDRATPRIACELASVYHAAGRDAEARHALARALVAKDNDTNWKMIAKTAEAFGPGYEGLARAASIQALPRRDRRAAIAGLLGTARGKFVPPRRRTLSE